MNRSLVVALILIIALLSVSATAGVATAERGDPGAQAPPFNETTVGSAVTTESASSSLKPYVVTAMSESAIDTEQLASYGNVGVQTERYIEVRISPNNRSAIERLSWVSDLRPAVRPEGQNIPGSSDGSSLGVEEAHSSGITGKGVTVGVIDTGFDVSNPVIEPNVIDSRSFTTTQQDSAHGTSVAEVVTQAAPDSDLHLASTDNNIQTKRAIEYLTEQNVDIIVMSLSFPAYEDDGDHFLTSAVSQAESEGTLFVTSAGNYAQRHWEGPFRTTDGDSVHEWTASGVERNCIPGCQSQLSGSVHITLRWEDTGQASDYGIGLYNPETEEYITTAAQVRSTKTNKYVNLRATLAEQPVDLIIANTDGTADDEVEVLVTSGASSIENRVPGSSLSAPADVPAAFTVAAYEVGSERIAPYSSRGPTDDGRLGVDVTGYTNIHVNNGLYGQDRFVFSGTSASAPYVGGVAALTTAQSGDIPAAGVADTLRSSSDDILDPGRDPISGSGVINTTAATNTGETPTDYKKLTTAVSPRTITANQSTAVTITVTDADNDEPIQDASVSIAELNLSATTDVNGEAVLSATPRLAGDYPVLVRAEGYAPANSTLTVTAVDGSGGDANSEVQLRVTDTPGGVEPNATFTSTYEIENAGTAASAYTIETNTDSPDVTVVNFSGDIQSSASKDNPPSASTDPVEVGEAASVTVKYSVTSAANGTVIITTTAREPLSGANQTLSQNVSIQTVPQDPTQRALRISGKQDPTQLTQNDVTAAITRFSRETAVNGINIRQDDITTLITLFERN